MKTTRKLSSLLPYVPVSLLALGGLSLAIQSACTAGSASSGSNKGSGDDTCGYEYYGVCYDDYADYAGTAGTASTATSSATSTAGTATTPTSPTTTATTSN